MTVRMCIRCEMLYGRPFEVEPTVECRCEEVQEG